MFGESWVNPPDAGSAVHHEVLTLLMKQEMNSFLFRDGQELCLKSLSAFYFIFEKAYFTEDINQNQVSAKVQPKICQSKEKAKFKKECVRY